MRILVTGASGFVGGHLINHLKQKHKVFATGRSPKPLAALDVPYFCMDITDEDSIKKVLKESTPDAVFHLAAQSMVRLAWDDPANTFNINTIGTINLINSLKETSPLCRLITVGSSEEYGLTGKTGERLTEEHPCMPQNPYAISKLAMGQMALQLAKKHELETIHIRPFNHFGPGQQVGYVVSDFASQVAEIEQGLKPPVLRVGDLTAQRDFTDVRDVAAAYALLLEKSPLSGVYNVCSGITRSAGEILEHLLNCATVPITVEQDRNRMRPSEVPLFVGSYDKLNQATGWQPMRQFEDSILDTLNWWRNRV